MLDSKTVVKLLKFLREKYGLTLAHDDWIYDQDSDNEYPVLLEADQDNEIIEKWVKHFNAENTEAT